MFSFNIQIEEIRQYFNDQVGKDLPPKISEELEALKERIAKMWNSTNKIHDFFMETKKLWAIN